MQIKMKGVDGIDGPDGPDVSVYSYFHKYYDIIQITDDEMRQMITDVRVSELVIDVIRPSKEKINHTKYLFQSIFFSEMCNDFFKFD